MLRDELIKEYHELGLETIMSEDMYVDWYLAGMERIKRRMKMPELKICIACNKLDAKGYHALPKGLVCDECVLIMAKTLVDEMPGFKERLCFFHGEYKGCRDKA